MDNISIDEVGSFAKKSGESQDGLSRDDQRRIINSFHKDNSVRKFILSEDIGVQNIMGEDLSLRKVLLFSSPSLEALKVEAKNREDVSERRDSQIEKNTRGNIIYNEGLRYGAQVALKMTILEYERHVDSNWKNLESNFTFSAYMLHKGTVIPPIINLSKDVVSVTETSLRKTNISYSLKQQAKFSQRPPHFKDYLTFQDYQVKPPSVFNAPVTDNELTHWMNGVHDGWKRGEFQASVEIQNAETRLKLDFLGMIRYHMLAKQGIVSEPIISKSKLGVSGDSQNIEVGVVNFIMDGKPVFRLDMSNWKPLPMIDEAELKEIVKNNNKQ